MEKNKLEFITEIASTHGGNINTVKKIFNNHLKSSWDDSIKNSKSRDADFDTLSGHHLDLCYFPNIIDNNYKNNLGFPGQYPYTRGIHPNLYRGRLWTMRQFAGYGTPEETNRRFKLLLNKG